MKMIVKEHLSKSGVIVSICDSDIIGKKYSENGIILDLSSEFYNGKNMSKTEAEKLCKRAYIINVAGKNAVAMVKKLGFANDNNIILIKNIPFAQCLIVQNEI